MLTNKQRYKTIVDDFLEQVAAYLLQFDAKIGIQVTVKRKTYKISHFDYNLPFRESPKSVRELDILTLRDKIKRHEFNTDSVVVFVSDKRRMIQVNYNQIYHKQC